jgi:hypothetical protein
VATAATDFDSSSRLTGELRLLVLLFRRCGSALRLAGARICLGSRSSSPPRSTAAGGSVICLVDLSPSSPLAVFSARPVL